MTLHLEDNIHKALYLRQENPLSNFSFGHFNENEHYLKLSAIEEFDFFYEDHSAIFAGLCTEVAEFSVFLADRSPGLLFPEGSLDQYKLLGELLFPIPDLQRIPASWSGSKIRWISMQQNSEIELGKLIECMNSGKNLPDGIPAMIIFPKAIE